jgi:hypothetical protein
MLNKVLVNVSLRPEAPDQVSRVDASLDLLWLRSLLPDALTSRHLHVHVAHPGYFINVCRTIPLPYYIGINLPCRYDSRPAFKIKYIMLVLSSCLNHPQDAMSVLRTPSYFPRHEFYEPMPSVGRPIAELRCLLDGVAAVCFILAACRDSERLN